MTIGDRFEVQFQEARFNAEIIAINPDDKTREFELKITDYFIGSDKKSDTFIEVELIWFTANPKRIVKPILI